MIDKKGIFTFLGITFLLTYALEGLMIALGLRFTNASSSTWSLLPLYAVMWVPALSTVITVKLVTKEGFNATGLHFGPFKAYLWPVLILLLCFAVIYGITWLFGLGKPDWQLTQLLVQMSALTGTVVSLPLPAGVFIGIALVATTFFSPFINSLFAFGEELGWRGYLLPKLMPLGKSKAYVIVGAIWGLWHLPLLLVGYNYGGANRLFAVIVFMLVTTAVGIYINEMTLRYKSTFLAAWLHGLLNSHGLGVWALLFVGVQPLLGGSRGIVGIAVWFLLGLITLKQDVNRSRKVLKEGS